MVVTFEDVPIFGDKEATNSFQVEMFFVDETICVTYLNVGASDGATGLSEGYDVPGGFIESDLSGYMLCCVCGDFNGDDTVDLVDFALLGQQWLEAGCGVNNWCDRVDTDRSNNVDIEDVYFVADNWGYPYTGPGEPIDPTLTGHWKLDETSGSITYDSSVYGNNGKLSNTPPTWTTGYVDGALDFDGVDDYVSLANNAITTTEFTIAAWAHQNGTCGGSNQSGVIFMQRDDNVGDNRSAVLLYTDNGPEACAAIRSSVGTAQILSSPKQNYNEWHHYAITLNSDDFIFYIDGSEVDREANYQLGDYVTSIDHVYLGKHAYSGGAQGFLNGLVDDARIYNSALSAADIQDLYTGIEPATTPDAHWMLNETTGTIVHDSVGTNDGTLSNTPPTWTGGYINGALDFDGVDDRIRAIGYKGVTGTQSKTCAAWVKTTHAGAVISSWGDYNVDGARWLLKTDATGTLRVSVGGGYIVGSEIITDDNWHFVAAVLESDGSPNADEIKLYVDGVEDTNTTANSQAITEGSVNADVMIGAFYTGSYYYCNGIIDDVRIYSSALSAANIYDLYTGTEPAVTPDAHWKLDEMSGTIAYDSAGTNHGTLGATPPIWTAGYINGALNFDGIDDYVIINDADEFKDYGTVSLWFKNNKESYGTDDGVIFISNQDYKPSLQIWFNDDSDDEFKVYANNGTTSETLSVSQLVPSFDRYAWHHIALSYDHLGVHVYLDGEHIGDMNVTGSFTEDGGDIRLGRKGSLNMSYFEGPIDDVRVYNRTLSAEEIEAIYFGQQPRQICLPW